MKKKKKIISAPRVKTDWSLAAIAGFILSFMGPLCILGIIFSSIGLAHTRDGLMYGRGLAIAGLVISIFATLFWLF